jgi:hypothetical protein
LGQQDGFFTLGTRLFLQRPLEIVFPFFTDAANLEAITPTWLRFEIVTPHLIAMHAKINRMIQSSPRSSRREPDMNRNLA